MKGTEVALLDSLAVQARTCVLSARMNLLQLGRVLTEAKPLVPHGQWEAWVKTNAQMSTRAAQSYMQAYATFGLDPDIAKLGTAKTMKLLPLTDEQRETLFAENDVDTMSTRQLDEAIKKQKEKLIQEARTEVQMEIEKERKARIAAEQRASDMETKSFSLEYETRLKEAEEKVKETQAVINRFDEEWEKTKQENIKLRQELEEQQEVIEEQQEEYNRAQTELLNIKSSIAKGDAERVPLDQLTPEIFASAVRSFIGRCARMPHMSFSQMNDVERQAYDELLRTIEGWAKDSRKALDTVTVEGVLIDHE